MISAYFVSLVCSISKDVLVRGHGFLLADRWYDVNFVYREIERNGYIPLNKPQKARSRGRFRRRARKIYNLYWRQYKQRARGESVFGSLTNAFGDRICTRMKKTTYIRSVARVICYQMKILIRINACFVNADNLFFMLAC